MGLKVSPFKVERVCAFCESRKDVLFPVSPKLCEACVVRVFGRQDVKHRGQRKMDLRGYRCDRCGKNTYFPVIVQTRICNPCTVKLGNQTMSNEIQRKYGARRVV